jgi:AcrR family transcriptional regulator
MGGGRAPGSDRSRPEGGDDEAEIAAAMLLAAGERGYLAASVQDAIDRSGLSRSRFYAYFANKEECFGRGCETAAMELCERILEAAAGEEAWPAAYRAGVTRLLRFVADEPLRARALMIEAPAAGGPASIAYERAVGRLTFAIDSARTPLDTHAPPPLTARFIVATVESTVREWLTAGKGSTCMSLLPELVHVAVLYYFGEEAAQEAFEGA